MPKIALVAENKRAVGNDFPKLFLDYGDKARIVCIEDAPETAYAHTLQAISVVNGEVEMKKAKGKNGEEYETPVKKFIGRHLCFGDFATLESKGKDPENCPTCAAANKNDAVGSAQRRFAMHVVRYRVVPGSTKVADPFGAELVVWAFTDARFNEIADIQEEHGDLKQRDLLLGPCENKMFQKYNIAVGSNAEWLASEDRKQFVAQLYQSSQIPDLSVAIARKLTKEQAQSDIEKVLEAEAESRGVAAPSNVGVNVDGLLSGNGVTSVNMPVEQTMIPATPPIVDMPATLPASAVSEPVRAVEEPSSQPSSEDVGKLDFASLLNGL